MTTDNAVDGIILSSIETLQPEPENKHHIRNGVSREKLYNKVGMPKALINESLERNRRTGEIITVQGGELRKI